MRNIIQAVLTFLLNGVWQIAAVALFSLLANHLLRSVTRFRHLVWVTALALALALPLLSSGVLRMFATSPAVSFRNAINEPVASVPFEPQDSRALQASSGFH